ncbi:hypothetical protein GNE88_25605 [Trichormus variabilis PNB]|uniref:hypothetical protein n=1 Tax=Anabaena variabilis TaxID=264691 RepID=UPI001624CCE8|nr:hypothetical protein [Trichormus variabilis]MBC1314395.1 hypothetical protein [Trichormus variabilis PNB]
MTKDVKIYNQSSSEVDGNYLEASQQLQLDKQNYGADYIHLYVDDIEGDWLENWDWEEDLADYIEAFYHHCEQGNYQFAFDTLKACDDILNQPENYKKSLELYSYLVQKLESLEMSKLAEINNQDILAQAKQSVLNLKNNKSRENMSEEITFTITERKITRIEYIRKLLEKIHNGVIRKTWKFQGELEWTDCSDFYNLKGTASSGDFTVNFGVIAFTKDSYYLSIKKGSEPEETIVNEECDSELFNHDNRYIDNVNFSYEEFKLIKEYLEKIEQANWQSKFSDLDALPE